MMMMMKKKKKFETMMEIKMTMAMILKEMMDKREGSLFVRDHTLVVEHLDPCQIVYPLHHRHCHQCCHHLHNHHHHHHHLVSLYLFLFLLHLFEKKIEVMQL